MRLIMNDIVELLSHEYVLRLCTAAYGTVLDLFLDVFRDSRSLYFVVDIARNLAIGFLNEPSMAAVEPSSTFVLRNC